MLQPAATFNELYQVSGMSYTSIVTTTITTTLLIVSIVSSDSNIVVLTSDHRSGNNILYHSVIHVITKPDPQLKIDALHHMGGSLTSMS